MGSNKSKLWENSNLTIETKIIKDKLHNVSRVVRGKIYEEWYLSFIWKKL